MQNHRKFSFIEDESAQMADTGPYDPPEVDEEDLWFLPSSGHATLDATDVPLPHADHRPLVDVTAWAQAEATLAAPLADLSFHLGVLTARLEAGPAGWRHRLALVEAADLSWLAGDRVPAERLALWLSLRLVGDGEDAQALARAGWAARRLQGGLPPQDGLAAFLGRESDDPRLADQIADWHEVMGQAVHMHRLTRAALGFHLWPVVGLSTGLGSAAPLPLMEAAVVAARYATADQNSPGAGSHFLPLALGGAGGVQGRGGAQDRLRRWIAGAEHAIRAALRLLDQVAAWEEQARETCANLSGRTPPQLITLLRDWPLVSAPMAEAETGASRAAIQRNLNWMTGRGIIREITGQGRYRFWTAVL